VTCAVIIEGISASDLSAAFLGKQHVYTAGETIEWAASLGPACAARAALVAKPLTPRGGIRSAICRISESSKATLKFGTVTATKFLMHHLLSGCTNRPRLEKGMGKKRAAGVPAASVASAVDLGDEEGSEPRAKRPNSTRFCARTQLRRARLNSIYQVKSS
jgi:hypothetical protein